MIIAIDGPSGVGKSTVAKAVAKKLHFSCLDTGAMYRCIAVYAQQNDIAFTDEEALTKIAEEKQISFGHTPGNPIPTEVFIDGQNVTDAIRTGEIDKAVSPVSAVAGVRSALTVQQQRIGNSGNYVVEGRDIGTVVFPEAEVKIFLSASDKERAHRRLRQNVDRGFGSIEFDEIFQSLVARDKCDSTREIAPLVAAQDAFTLDSTNMYIEEVINKICDLASSIHSGE